MGNHQDQSKIEVDLSKGKVKVHGVYEDLRPIVKTGVDAVNNLIQVFESLTGLTREILNDRLEKFRQTYHARVEAIPSSHRQPPPFRLTCNVLREAVFAADEPDLQEMFANLLSTGSDERIATTAHPGFANAISQLTSFDADVLVALSERQYIDFHSAGERWPNSHHDFNLSTSNLCRIGLAEWKTRGIGPFFAQEAKRAFESAIDPHMFRGANTSTPNSALTTAIGRGAKNLAELVGKQITESQKYTSITLTDYGRAFVSACLEPGTE